MAINLRTNLFTVFDPDRLGEISRKAGFLLEADLGGKLFSISGKVRNGKQKTADSIERYFQGIAPLVTSRLVARVLQSDSVDWYVIVSGVTYIAPDDAIFYLLQTSIPDREGNPFPDILTPLDEILPTPAQEDGR